MSSESEKRASEQRRIVQVIIFDALVFAVAFTMYFLSNNIWWIHGAAALTVFAAGVVFLPISIERARAQRRALEAGKKPLVE